MGERHRAREFALQMLFQIDIGGMTLEETIPTFWESRRARGITREYAEQLVQGTLSHREKIDRLIGDSTEHWRLERMGGVDRNILRLAVFEFLFQKETPSIVIIDEAIEMAKRFGGEDSAPFVNGILDSLRLRLEADDPTRPLKAGPRQEPG